MTNITPILNQLKQRRDKINDALMILGSLEGTARAQQIVRKGKKRGPKTMSPEARRKISRKLRKIWAERKARAHRIGRPPGSKNRMNGSRNGNGSRIHQVRKAA